MEQFRFVSPEIRDAQRKQRATEIQKLIQELNPRAEAIRGEIYAFDEDAVHYHRWKFLLKESIPPEFKKFVHKTRMDFAIPEQKDELLAMLEHDEKIFPEKFQQFKAKQKPRTSKKAP